MDLGMGQGCAVPVGKRAEGEIVSPRGGGIGGIVHNLLEALGKEYGDRC